MKQLKLEKLQTIEGGNSTIDGACYGITGVNLAYGGAKAFARYFGKVALQSALKGILGGPVGWALNVATVACFAYAGYKHL